MGFGVWVVIARLMSMDGKWTMYAGIVKSRRKINGRPRYTLRKTTQIYYKRGQAEIHTVNLSHQTVPVQVILLWVHALMLTAAHKINGFHGFRKLHAHFFSCMKNYDTLQRYIFDRIKLLLHIRTWPGHFSTWTQWYKATHPSTRNGEPLTARGEISSNNRGKYRSTSSPWWVPVWWPSHTLMPMLKPIVWSRNNGSSQSKGIKERGRLFWKR